jgi:hypothetical protein
VETKTTQRDKDRDGTQINKSTAEDYPVGLPIQLIT